MKYVVQNNDTGLWYIRYPENVTANEVIVRPVTSKDNFLDFPKKPESLIESTQNAQNVKPRKRSPRKAK